MATGSFVRKSFTGGAAPTTLSAPLAAGATSVTVADGSSYPTGASNPFVIVIGRGTATEEKLLIASRSGNTLTVTTRGYDDGTDQAHTIGEEVEHVLDASTIDQANRYVNLQSAKGALVGHDGTNPTALTVGTNGFVLVADSTASTGLAWSNRLTTAETDITTAEGNITTLQSNVTTLQTDVTNLQGTDIVVTLTGDATGSATITNLADVSIAVTVVDDSHNHTIANVDGLQTALDGKQATGSYLTTSSSFGGDVSGTYDAIVIADDSHNHTTSNIDSFTESVQDIVGAMVTGNTETGLSVTYQDSDGTLDFALTKDPTITLSGDLSGSGTMTDLGDVTITATVSNDSHSHSNYLTSSSNLNASNINSGTVNDSYIDASITRDTEIASSGFGLYGYSSSGSSRNSNTYFTLWITSSAPTASTKRTGDLWIDT